MKIILTLLVSLNLSILSSAEVDYSQFNNIEEVIDFETETIANASINDLAALIDSFISRGESYLISGQAELALLDFQKADELVHGCFNEERSRLKFKILFGQVVAYSCLDKENAALMVSLQLSEEINSLQCHGCNHQKALSFHQINQPVILGHDQVIPGYCEEVVRGTAEAMRYLASLAKKHSTKMALLATIQALEVKCVKCCATGAFWKSCVTPIIEKWQQWNDKWRFFGVPPDPAWD